MNRLSLAWIASLLASVAFASDSDDLLASMQAASTNAAPNAKAFTTLPLCKRIEGSAFVRRPNGAWEPAEEGKFYFFGLSFRAGTGSTLEIAFGSGSSVTVSDGSAFGTRAQAIGTSSRTIYPINGTLDLKLADNLPEGAFFVTAPGFTIKNPAGVSRIVYEDMGDGDQATVRCVTGSLAIEGRHFDIPAMRPANEVKIRTSLDHLCTILYGTSGDYVVKVDQGVRLKEEFGDDGKVKVSEEKGELEWRLTPSTKVIINRAVPAIGERMSVHTMAFDASGERKSECSFCEGRAQINTGELVPKDKVSGEDLARRAAEVTEEKAAETTEEVPAEEAASSDANANAATDSNEQQ